MLQKVATTGIDLNNVYDQTLRRIKEQQGDRSRLGMEVLMWISHAERPLQIDELCHALAVEMGATDLDLENLRPQDTVLRSCFGLAVVDKETSKVRLIHYTLQEYLSRPGVLPGAHRTLGQKCLTYLNYVQVKRLPADNTSNLKNMPFLEYSSLHWGVHAKTELSDYAKSLALELLNQYDSHISSRLLFERIEDPWSRPPSHRPFPGLHCAAYFGIDEILATLIAMEGCDINQGDYKKFTPLVRASQKGNQGAVMLLLARDDVNPDKPGYDGETPLWWASRNGHEGVARLLLARDDVNPGKPKNQGQTPLCTASRNGHEGVVGLLLTRNDVDPHKPDNHGQTPLWRASFHGHDGVVRLLIARSDVNPNQPSYKGETPLWRASCNGHQGVLRLLLARDDVNPDKPDNDGITPLQCALSEGHEGVVKLLHSRSGINPEQSDNNSLTPLPSASSDMHEEVARTPVARDDVTPDEPDNDDITSLQPASSNGHEGVVRPPVARGDVDPYEQDNSSQPPPKISSIRKYRRIIAEHVPRLWGKNKKGKERL